MGIDIAATLKEKRKNSRLSVTDVLERLHDFGVDIAPKTLYGWESGHRQPDSDTFILLCQIYGIESLTEIKGTKKSPGTAETEPREAKLIELYRELNDEGQELLVGYADTLVKSEKHVRNTSPVSSISIAARNGMRIERSQKESFPLPEESDIIP